MFDTWLMRSQNSPLNLRIVFQIRNEGNTVMAEHIVESLLYQQRRWRDVKFRLKFRASPGFLGSDLTDIPMLVSLDFLSSVTTGDVPRASLMNYRVGVANSIPLQELNLGGDYSIKYGEQPLHTLTRVLHRLRKARRKFEVLAEYYVLKLLRVAPNPKALSTETPSDLQLLQERVPAAASNFLVHGIHKLAINDVRERLASLVLPEVTLSSLKCLDYTGRNSVVADLVLRSPPRLESLEIMSHSHSPSQDALVPGTH